VFVIITIVVVVVVVVIIIIIIISSTAFYADFRVVQTLAQLSFCAAF
jgi:hypothetical protein